MVDIARCFVRFAYPSVIRLRTNFSPDKQNGLSKLNSRSIIVLLCCSLLSACATRIENCIDTGPHPKLVVIGDSYSDIGNIAVDNVLDFPDPFHDGRFSNGLVAADFLAAHLATDLEPSLHTVGCRYGYNYAVGGGNVTGSKDQDMLCQVNKYLNRMSGVADSSAWYFVMLGGNDVRQMDTSLSASDVDAELDATLDQLIKQVQRLLDAGAQKVIIANSGDMGRLPSSISDGNGAVLSAYSLNYNTKFVSRISDLQAANSGKTILVFDLFSAMSDILDNPSTHGFNNHTQACVDIEKFPRTGPDDVYVNGCTETTIDEFVFFDSVHATSKTHRLIADQIIAALP